MKASIIVAAGAVMAAAGVSGTGLRQQVLAAAGEAVGARVAISDTSELVDRDRVVVEGEDAWFCQSMFDFFGAKSYCTFNEVECPNLNSAHCAGAGAVPANPAPTPAPLEMPRNEEPVSPGGGPAVPAGAKTVWVLCLGNAVSQAECVAELAKLDLLFSGKNGAPNVVFRLKNYKATGPLGPTHVQALDNARVEAKKFSGWDIFMYLQRENFGNYAGRADSHLSCGVSGAAIALRSTWTLGHEVGHIFGYTHKCDTYQGNNPANGYSTCAVNELAKTNLACL